MKRELHPRRAVLVTAVALSFTVLAANPAFAATGTVLINQGGLGTGTTTSTPAGIACTTGPDGPLGACTVAFEEGTKIRLRAVAADGSKFAGWAPARTCPKGRFTVVAGETHVCVPVFEPK